jgi:hypothetical protein
VEADRPVEAAAAAGRAVADPSLASAAARGGCAGRRRGTAAAAAAAAGSTCGRSGASGRGRACGGSSTCGRSSATDRIIALWRLWRLGTRRRRKSWKFCAGRRLAGRRLAKDQNRGQGRRRQHGDNSGHDQPRGGTGAHLRRTPLYQLWNQGGPNSWPAAAAQHLHRAPRFLSPIHRKTSMSTSGGGGGGVGGGGGGGEGQQPCRRVLPGWSNPLLAGVWRLLTSPRRLAALFLEGEPA